MRLRRLAVIGQRPFRTDGIWSLENPVLPRGQAAIDFCVERFWPRKAKRRFHSCERVGRKRSALLYCDANLVFPIKIVGRESDETCFFCFFCVESAFVLENLVGLFRLGQKTRLQAR